VAGGGLDTERGAIVHSDLTGSQVTFNTGTSFETFQSVAGSVTRPFVFKGGNVIGSGSTTVGTVDAPITLQGNVTLEANVGGIPSLTVNNPIILNGNIIESGGSFSVTKLGVSTATLGGTNTYSGGTIISGGTLATASATALGAGTVEVDSGAFLDLNGNAPAVAALSSTGTGTIGNSSTTAVGTLNYAGNPVNPSTFNGVIRDVLGAGTQKSALTVSSGSLTLAAANTYTGNTTVNAGGTLVLASSGSIGAAGNVTVNGTLTSNQTSQTIASLNGAAGGALVLNGTTLTVSNGGTFGADWNDGATASTITNAGGTLALNGATASGGTVNANAAVNFGGTSGITPATRLLNTLNIAASTAVKITHSQFPFTPTIVKPTNTSFGAGSTLDLTNNAFITTGTASGAFGQLQSGQIISSEPSDAIHAIGYVDLGGADAGKFEVRYTLKGDTNLDGKVDVGDLGALATSYGISGGMSWANGDFNRDQNVDVGDLGALATNYGTQLGTGPSFGDGATVAQSLSAGPLSLVASPAAAVSGSAVPEPGTLGLLGIGAIALLGRRQRKET
jgi:autotransporter-associated beta strand protein